MTTQAQQLSFGVKMDKKEIERLCAGGRRVYQLMKDGRWRTLREIADATNMSEAAASARLRDFRKPAFGSHKVPKQERASRLYEYKLIPAKLTQQEQFKLGVFAVAE